MPSTERSIAERHIFELAAAVTLGGGKAAEMWDKLALNLRDYHQRYGEKPYNAFMDLLLIHVSDVDRTGPERSNLLLRLNRFKPVSSKLAG